MRISDWSSDVCSSDLLLHPIHRGGAIVDFPDLVGFAGIIKDTLGGGRLTGIDMRHDADIAIVLERMRSEEHTSELQSLMRISYAVFCLKKKKKKKIF